MSKRRFRVFSTGLFLLWWLLAPLIGSGLVLFILLKSEFLSVSLDRRSVDLALTPDEWIAILTGLGLVFSAFFPLGCIDLWSKRTRLRLAMLWPGLHILFFLVVVFELLVDFYL